MSDVAAGGTWSSDNTSIASVTSGPIGGGIVTSMTAGVVNIFYHYIGCITGVGLTVNPMPSITGATNICISSTTTLSSSLGGGTWSSSNTSVATVSDSGVVSGLIVGTTIISYILNTGCDNNITITLNNCPTGVPIESSVDNITIYPNPIHNEFTVTSTKIVWNLVITNLVGQIVYTSNFNSKNAQVNVVDLPMGIYIIKINGSEVRKFVKE